jgi:phage baseplate assembly protein W
MTDFVSKSFMGTGWSFPPAFEKSTAQVTMTSDEEDIQKSLEILISTRLGERVMLPGYGCNMEHLLFEPLTLSLKTYMRDLLQTAILYHEARIKLDKLDMSNSVDNEGIVLIEISYTVKATNSRFNYVYPYYKNEASR